VGLPGKGAVGGLSGGGCHERAEIVVAGGEAAACEDRPLGSAVHERVQGCVAQRQDIDLRAAFAEAF
jgi:hypothetical protein